MYFHEVLKPDDLNSLNFSNFNFSDGQVLWVKIPAWEMAVKILAWLPIVIVGLIGNSAIIIVMCRVKSMRTCTNLFFLNMAVADLITILFSSWTILATDFYQNYILGPFFCRSEGFIQVTCLLSSVFSLVAVSCDRLLAVTLPLVPRLNKKKAYILMVVIWLISMAFATPTIIYRSWHERQWSDYLEIYCSEDKRLKYFWFTILVFLCYLPLTHMTVAYCVIIIQLDRYEHRLFLGEQPLKKKYRKKVLKMLFIYLVNFIWCWVLFQLVILYRYFKPSGTEFPEWYKPVYFVAHLLTYCHSAINPIVYGAGNENFYKAARLTFPCLFHLNRINPRPIEIRPIEEAARIENGAPKEQNKCERNNIEDKGN